jgi:hypothetical protein
MRKLNPKQKQMIENKRTDINEIENRKKINKTKTWFPL